VSVAALAWAYVLDHQRCEEAVKMVFCRRYEAAISAACGYVGYETDGEEVEWCGAGAAGDVGGGRVAAADEEARANQDPGTEKRNEESLGPILNETGGEKGGHQRGWTSYWLEVRLDQT
jgi:hypothetical protein